MASDRSRRIDTPRFGYKGVVAQQGRVILDRDFNAQQSLAGDRVALDALSLVGHFGSPDAGFLIGPPPAFSGPPASPPGSPPASPPSIPHAPDLAISPGLIYLGGQAVVLPPPGPYSYSNQPDWPAPAPVAATSFELVYLDVTQLEVSAVEDPDLLEVALGGPDTTQRQKLLRRVCRMPAPQPDNLAAWAQAVAQWQAQGLAFDPLTMRLTPAVGLKIGFTSTGAANDPCDPVATGGYLGADNQLIRIRIVNSGGAPLLLWGYDNANFLYRVASVSADKTMLKLTSDPPDAFHFPQIGQYVEVLASAAFLGSERDETDPTGVAQIVQAAAEATGFVTPLAQAYGPAVNGDPTNYLVFPTGAWPGSFADNSLPIFVRVWQSAAPLPAGGGTVTLTQASAGGATPVSTGVTATISLPSGGVLPDGAFWEVAVRPGTPQGAYPETLLTAPQPPDGPSRWVCPLAVIDWTGASGQFVSIEDCRALFAPATGRFAPLMALYAPETRSTPLPSGGSVQLDILARGLMVSTPVELDASSVTAASVRLYADLPVTISQLMPGSSDGRMAGVQSIALAADVTMPSANRIVVTPTQAAQDLLALALARRITTGTSSDFTNLFTTVDFGPNASSRAVWVSNGDGSVSQTNSGAAIPASGLPALAPSLALCKQTVISPLSYVSLTYNCGPANGSAGVVFNWTSNADFWVFYNARFDQVIGFSGGFAQLSSSVQHFVNGQAVATFAVGPTVEPAESSTGLVLGSSVDLDISASSGGLNFQTIIRYTNGSTINFSLSPLGAGAGYPGGFISGARVGLMAIGKGDMIYTRLQFTDAADGTVSILPAGSLGPLALRLVAKPSLLRTRAEQAAANSVMLRAAPEPDFETDFFVTPAPGGYYGYAGPHAPGIGLDAL